MKFILQYEKAHLPASVGACMTEQDGQYLILVNADHTADEQAAAFLHEMLHIWNRDTQSAEPAADIERRTRAQLLRILAAE